MSKYKIYTSYARTAIYLVLLSIGVRGKKILLPAFTCATTLPDAIVQAGGIPVFVDFDVYNLEMIQNDIINKISSDTIAIISHHYYGFYMDYVIKIRDIAKKYNLVHIEDRAHCYGLRRALIGDVVIYSFSKNMISPGGGLIVTKNHNIWQRCLNIQEKNKSIFHKFVLNTEAFNYMEAIKNERSCSEYKKSESLKFIKMGISKLLKTLGFYQKNYFYKIICNDIGENFHIFYTRITSKQLKYILIAARKLKSAINNRINIALKLNEILPSFFDVDNNIFTNYVIYSDELEKLESIFCTLGIKTRRVWPCFQKYWYEQKTPNVEDLSKKLLLIDLDCFNEEKIGKLRGMLNGN